MRYIEAGTNKIEDIAWRVAGRAIHFEWSDPEYMGYERYKVFADLLKTRGLVHHNSEQLDTQHPRSGWILKKGRGLKKIIRASVETSGLAPKWYQDKYLVCGVYKMPDSFERWYEIRNPDDQGLYLAYVNPEMEEEVMDLGRELLEVDGEVDRVLLQKKGTGDYVQLSRGEEGIVEERFDSSEKSKLKIPYVPQYRFRVGWEQY